jgi:hypothetical protein
MIGYKESFIDEVHQEKQCILYALGNEFQFGI